MTQQEFIDLHGEEAWEKLVEPLQAAHQPHSVKCNANAISHFEIMPILSLLGLSEATGLLQAKEAIKQFKDAFIVQACRAGDFQKETSHGFPPDNDPY